MNGAAKLPLDLLIQVFVKLPVRTLVRFRCVSRFLNDLIRSPYFVRLHLNRADRDETVFIKCDWGREIKLCLHSYQSLTTITPNLESRLEFYYKIWIIGSCNGLICMKSKDFLYLCNPALMEFKKIPEHTFVWPSEDNICVPEWGFGYDSVTDDYKVVSVGSLNDTTFPGKKAAVYYLSTGCWREFDVNIPYIHEVVFEYCNLFINGACHWLALEKAEPKMCILAFNFIGEVFRTIELPDACVDFDREIDNILVLHQMLTLVRCRLPEAPEYRDIEHPDHRYFEVWVMKEYGVKESWVRQYVVGSVHGCPLSIWKNNQLLVQGWDGQLVSLALDAEEHQEFEILSRLGRMQVVIYQESLFSLG